MMKAALIVVDVQNDFITGTLALKNCSANEDGEEVIEMINNLSQMTDWDTIVFTKDWHPADHISFVTNAHKFDQHLESTVDKHHAEVYDTVVFEIEGEKRDQVMWPPHCIKESWGAKFHKDLKIPDNSHIVEKGSHSHADSYSAFFDNCKLHSTTLDNILKTDHIEIVFICGLATDICVYYTVIDSVELGYKTYFIDDACRGVHSENISNAKARMKERGVHLIESNEVAAILAGTKIPPEV